MRQTKVIIVDDQPIVCAGLSYLVNRQSDMKVAGGYHDLSLALENTPKLAPDLMILNISLPGTNGVDATKSVKSLHPEMQVLAISNQESQSYVKTIIDAGATGYILKKAALDEILIAIRSVAGGNLYLDSSLVNNVVNGFLKKPRSQDLSSNKELSERETQVLKLMASGYGMKEVAYSMKVSIKTVDTYKRRSFEKLGLHTRVQLLKFALAQGWLFDEPVR